jgi:hypothetical protein
MYCVICALTDIGPLAHEGKGATKEAALADAKRSITAMRDDAPDGIPGLYERLDLLLTKGKVSYSDKPFVQTKVNLWMKLGCSAEDAYEKQFQA